MPSSPPTRPAGKNRPQEPESRAIIISAGGAAADTGDAGSIEQRDDGSLHGVLLGRARLTVLPRPRIRPIWRQHLVPGGEMRAASADPGRRHRHAPAG